MLKTLLFILLMLKVAYFLVNSVLCVVLSGLDWSACFHIEAILVKEPSDIDGNVVFEELD